MQYISLIMAAVLLAVDFSLQKVYQKSEGVTSCAGFRFNSLLGLCTGLIFLAINGFRFELCGYSVIMAGLVNIIMMCYTIIGFRLLKSGTMAIYTLFLMSGGMILPYVFGLLFLDEPFVPLRMVALMLILAGVVFANVINEKTNTKQLLLCVIVFFLNGFVSIISKLHQIESVFETVTVTEFVMIGGFFKFVFAGVLYFVMKNRGGIQEVRHFSPVPVIIIFVDALVGGITYLLQLQGAASLPATVLYPFITGGGIVFSSLSGVFFFRERLSRNSIIGIILCFVGTIIFL